MVPETFPRKTNEERSKGPKKRQEQRERLYRPCSGKSHFADDQAHNPMLGRVFGSGKRLVSN